MSTFKITWLGEEAAAEVAASLISETLWPPCDGVSYMRDEHDQWRVEAYFVEKPDAGALDIFVEPSGVKTPGILEELEDRDWVADSLEGLGLIEAGRFVLYGVHDTDKVDPADEKIPIRIDANQAFGTGHHPTTEGCLTLLDRFAGFAPKTILDLGCGSAVLAIAAAKLWDRAVLASDIDAPSVEIAAENARLNGVDELVSVIVADGFSHPEIADRAPFDFVFANILAGPLREFAPEMARHVKPNGRVMLAGLMAEQEEQVLEAYDQAGFRLLNRLDHAVWPVLLLVRQTGDDS